MLNVKIISSQFSLTANANMIKPIKVHGAAASLHGPDWRKKIYWRMLWIVDKEPRTTSREIQAEV